MTHRKMFKIKMMLLLVAALLIGFTMHAQVTIGSEEAPVTGSLLQLKDKPSVSDGGFNANKGVALPRVLLTEKDQLFPMFESDGAGGYKIGTTPYVKANEDKKHTGLIVYNLTEDLDKELCLGLNQWDGKEWNCFETKMGNAIFDSVQCAGITVNGTYIEGTAATAAEYLTVNLNVTKAGAFFITATSGNGYNFYLSGVALSAGPMTVNVPCQGIPVNEQKDTLTLSGLNLVSGCLLEVEVVAFVAEYTLNCASIAVNGKYLKRTPLIPDKNTITLHVTVSTAGSYSITTPVTNGIHFSASGNLPTTGAHIITLNGSGTPTINLDFPITIHANTPFGNTTCTAHIPITLPAMTYGIIASSLNQAYSWNSDERRRALNLNNVVFSDSGIVKIESFKPLSNWTTPAPSASEAVSRLGMSSKPDIVFYNAYSISPDNQLITALVQYVNDGGCLIFGSADNGYTAVNNLMVGIFGNGAGTASAQGSSTPVLGHCAYPINNYPSDPLINGPFGNLAGKWWGEDNEGSIVLSQLPAGSVQVCPAYTPYGHKTVNPDWSIVWYNDAKNFVYIGDCVASTTTDSSNVWYAAMYSNTGVPQNKLFGADGDANKQYVYNAALEMNAVAYLIKKAAVSGINPH
ncbi:hypothetical protein FACS1894160_3520 [Bacteroidia bacterium]|nr:hypothetical protein FACS1894123_06230 [Bacteroidia bacterium]GHV08733.1 hypothetical protein FACS1894160_3520 [Bacteroidia bacterium]